MLCVLFAEQVILSPAEIMGSELIHVEIEEVVSLLLPQAISTCRGEEEFKKGSFQSYCGNIDKRYSDMELELSGKISSQL